MVKETLFSKYLRASPVRLIKACNTQDGIDGVWRHRNCPLEKLYYLVRILSEALLLSSNKVGQSMP